MSYKQIEKMYIVVSSIIRDNAKILICRSKQDGEYAFFEDNGLNYKVASPKINNELSKVFNILPRKYVYVTYASRIPTSEIATYSNYVVPVISIISELTKDLSPSTRKRVMSNLETLTIDKFNLSEHSLSENSSLKIGALYSSNEHLVCINPTSANRSNLYLTLHEMIHASTAVGNRTDTGFTLFKTIHGKSASFSTSVALLKCCEGINEAVTDYYAAKALMGSETLFSKNPHLMSSAYDHVANVYHNLNKNLNDKLCREAFFSGNLEIFLQHVKDVYKLDSDHLLVKMVYQMDAVIALSLSKRDLNPDDFLYLITDLYKTCTDIMFNKLVKENVNVSNVRYEDCFDGFKLFPEYDFKSLYDLVLENNKLYFEAKKLASIIENAIPDPKTKKDIFKKTCQLQINVVSLILNAANKKTPICFNIPEEFNTKEFILGMLLNNHIYADAQTHLMGINANLSEIIAEQLLNPNNQFLPASHDKRYEIISHLIENRRHFNFPVTKTISNKDYALWISQDNSNLLKLLKNSEMSRRCTKILACIDDFTKFNTVQRELPIILAKIKSQKVKSNLLLSVYRSYSPQVRIQKSIISEFAALAFNSVFDKNMTVEFQSFMMELSNNNYAEDTSESSTDNGIQSE